MTAMTGGDAVVGELVRHGVTTVFGLPGAQIYGLYDALQRAGLRVIGTRHEQACAYMAFGYARSTGRAGVYAVVPGPVIEVPIDRDSEASPWPFIHPAPFR